MDVQYFCQFPVRQFRIFFRAVKQQIVQPIHGCMHVIYARHNVEIQRDLHHYRQCRAHTC